MYIIIYYIIIQYIFVLSWPSYIPPPPILDKTLFLKIKFYRK